MPPVGVPKLDDRFILNDAAYGSERSYSGLRLARTLVKRDGVSVRVFLIGDALTCAKSGQFGGMCRSLDDGHREVRLGEAAVPKLALAV